MLSKNLNEPKKKEKKDVEMGEDLEDGELWIIKNK